MMTSQNIFGIICFTTIIGTISSIPYEYLDTSTSLNRIRRQINAHPYQNTARGGYINDISYRGRYLDAEILQNYNRHGQSGPKQYLLGGKYDPNEYVEVYFGLDEIPHYQKRTEIRVNGKVLLNPNVNAFVQHSQTRDSNWQRQQKVNSAGISYNSINGGTIEVNGVQVPGQSSSLTVSGGVPLYQGDNVAVNVQVSRTYVQGQKPSYSVYLQVQGLLPN